MVLSIWSLCAIDLDGNCARSSRWTTGYRKALKEATALPLHSNLLWNYQRIPDRAERLDLNSNGTIGGYAHDYAVDSWPRGRFELNSSGEVSPNEFERTHLKFDFDNGHASQHEV